jgi:hypothetical protein
MAWLLCCAHEFLDVLCVLVCCFPCSELCDYGVAGRKADDFAMHKIIVKISREVKTG